MQHYLSVRQGMGCVCRVAEEKLTSELHAAWLQASSRDPWIAAEVLKTLSVWLRSHTAQSLSAAACLWRGARNVCWVAADASKPVSLQLRPCTVVFIPPAACLFRGAGQAHTFRRGRQQLGCDSCPSDAAVRLCRPLAAGAVSMSEGAAAYG